MFIRDTHTEREIDAPPEAVWGVLTDLGSYGGWNPQVMAIDGCRCGGRWLYEGNHTFELHPLNDGRTRFVDHERVSGLFARAGV
jgi:hypothetical protein